MTTTKKIKCNDTGVTYKVTHIDNINTFEGVAIGDIVCHEKGSCPVNDDDAVVLYGFDEVGMFDGNFKQPAYAIVYNTLLDKL